MGLGIGAVLGVSVKAANNIPIPAGYDAGFVIRDNGLLGLLSVQVLGGMSIRTYLGGQSAGNKIIFNAGRFDGARRRFAGDQFQNDDALR